MKNLILNANQKILFQCMLLKELQKLQKDMVFYGYKKKKFFMKNVSLKNSNFLYRQIINQLILIVIL